MNQFSGMEMAGQRRAEFEREAGLHRQMRAAKTDAHHRIRRVPRLVSFRRPATTGTGSPRTRAWRLSRS